MGKPANKNKALLIIGLILLLAIVVGLKVLHNNSIKIGESDMDTPIRESTESSSPEPYIAPYVPVDRTDEQLQFVHADGTRLVDETGSDFQIKGIAFGNAIWTQPARISPYPNEENYQELSEIGFNCVRFYLNYGFFEDDDNPYVYKEEGWDWLDRHLEWAEKHGIKLLLNMHWPQGGGQAVRGLSAPLWKNENEEQERLAALWGAIAQRYSDNPSILGYGLVNEPQVNWMGDVDKSINQWVNLAQQITDQIRVSDQNHLIFIENIIGALDEDTGRHYYDLNEDENFILVNDISKNIVFEFHYYMPFQYLNMNKDMVSLAAPIWHYPNPWMLMVEDGYSWVETTGSAIISTREINAHGKWVVVESNLFTIPESDVNILSAAVATKELGNGTALFDDISITAYDQQGNFVEEIFSWDFNNEKEHWDNIYSESSATTAFEPNDGAGENGALGVKGNGYTSVNSSSSVYLDAQPQYQYKISAAIKLEVCSDKAIAYPQFVLGRSNYAYPFDKPYLEAVVDRYIAIGNKYTIPVWLGEFGANEGTYEGRGGEQWVEDVIVACNERGIGFSYHLFEGGGYGLYSDSFFEKPTTIKTGLLQAFNNAINP